MRRRDFLKTTALGSTSLLLGGAGCSSNEVYARPNAQGSQQMSTAGDRPNVLIIMTDQHRHDLMTCAGRDLVPTPNIDRIARNGVRFTHAYCPYPVCVASRMSLLTGLYPHNTGAIDNVDPLDWRYRTMANHFAENGYLTALIGKMHFNDAHKHGFEYYLSINDWLMYLGPKVQHYADEIASHQHTTHFFNTVHDSGAGFPDVESLWDGPSPWVGNVKRYKFDTVASRLEPEDHLDMFIARETAKFLERYRRQRFFLVASFMKPHTPFFPPAEYAAKYPVDKMELPPVGDISTYPPHIQNRIRNYTKKDKKLLKAGRAGYLGNLAFADTCVGFVYDALANQGLLDNTIVVYTSDHGEMDGDHGLWQKFCLFEPSVRVPLIVSWPKKLPKNKVADALTEYIGIYPSLVDLAGIPAPEGTTLHPIPGAPQSMDADSFAEIALDPSRPGPDAAFSEYALRSALPQYMIRTRRHKYIYNHGSTHELYDHRTDPGETVNRIDDPALADIRKELSGRIAAWYDPKKNPYRKI